MGRRKRHLIAMVSLLAVVMLGSMGLGYALWSDALLVSGTVNTGTLTMKFAAPTNVGDNEGANVGTCGAEVTNGGKTLSVTVGNAYPGYECHFEAVAKSEGTVPGVLNAFGPSSSKPIPSAITVDYAACTALINATGQDGGGRKGTLIPVGETRKCAVSIKVKSDNTNATLNEGGAAVAAFDLDLGFTNYAP